MYQKNLRQRLNEDALMLSSQSSGSNFKQQFGLTNSNNYSYKNLHQSDFNTKKQEQLMQSNITTGTQDFSTQLTRLREQNLTLARKFEQSQDEVERCHD